MACEEAELGPDKFAERMQMQHKLQEQVELFSLWMDSVENRHIKERFIIFFQQLEMLKHLRKFHLDDQSEILEKVHLFLYLLTTGWPRAIEI